MVAGSQVYIHRHPLGPSQNVGKRVVWLPVDVLQGPKSTYINISGMPKRYGPTDEDNNYLYDPESDPEAFDAVHTFAVVQRVVGMYKRSLIKLPEGYRRVFSWPWGKSPLVVHPHAGKKNSAAYVRSLRSLSFFQLEDKASGIVVQTCQSFGAVAHEAGHAVLDGIKPRLTESGSVETLAVQESFADLTVLFVTLDFMDMCDMAMSKMKGDLQNSNFLLQIAQEMGLGHGKDCIRNIDKTMKISEATEDRYVWSQVFTGAIYSILASIVKRETDTTIFDPAATLYRSAKHVMSALLRAVLDAPDQCTFRDLASGMVSGAENERVKVIMQKEFTWRQFFDPSAHPRPI